MAQTEQPKRTLTCPQCGTRYITPEPPRREATYRCARCQHLFSIQSPEALDADEVAPIQSAFDFDDDDVELQIEEQIEEEIKEEVAPPRKTEKPPPGKTIAADDGPAFVRDASAGGSDLNLPPEPAFMSGEPDDVEERELATAARRLSWVQIGVRFEAAVFICFAIVGLYLLANPEQAIRLVENTLLGGASLGASSSALDSIEIVDLQGARQATRENVPTFVITGEVINNSTRPVGAVQVEGRLYSDGEEIARKAVFAGAKASHRLVQSLTAIELSMLEKIKPPKTYRLAPGASDAFLIIFQNVPETLGEFACRIVSAQPVAG